jgi:Undecaprenyl-phosphate galactose phosphotransferase WbaP
MSVTIGTEIEIAPSGWYFKAKLRIGFSYFSHYALNAIVLLTADVIGLVLAFELAAHARELFWGSPMSPVWVVWLVVCWAMGAFAWGLLPAWGLCPVECLRRQVSLTAIVFSGVAVALFLTKSSVGNSRFTILCAFLLAVPLIPFMRMLAKRELMRWHLWGIPVAIYGGGVVGRSIIRSLQEEPGQGYCPVCVFDDNPDLIGGEIEGVPVRGNTGSIVQDVPLAILAITQIEGERIAELVEGSLASYLKVMIIPNLVFLPSLWVNSRDLSGTPGLELSNNLLDPGKCVIKRSIEYCLTVLTIPLWGPLCILVGGLIWLGDREDPIFKQKRIGEDGRVFDTWKFRTMVPDAEAVLEQQLDQDEALRAEWERDCKLSRDPRITKLGRFLRRSSLDEIPQLVNVLRGEMSLIGPRPLPNYHHEQLPSSVRKLRERVKPGMTGLWQVSGRSEVGSDGMVRWDPYYVRNWSLWLDVVILVRTVRVVMAGSGAR